MKSTTIRHDAMAAQTNQRPKVCSFQYTPCRPCLFVWMMASDERIAFLTGTGYFDFFRADFIIVYDFHRSIYFRNVCNLSIWFKSNDSFFLSFVYITSLPWWPFNVWVLLIFTRTSDFLVLLHVKCYHNSHRSTFLAICSFPLWGLLTVIISLSIRFSCYIFLARLN